MPTYGESSNETIIWRWTQDANPIFVCSAISRATLTSFPRFLPVISILVCPNNSFTCSSVKKMPHEDVTPHETCLMQVINRPQ